MNSPNREHRIRSTLTHEMGHVILHKPLRRLDSLVTGEDDASYEFANRSGSADVNDWCEWQARYFSGAVLIPARELKRQQQIFMSNPFEGPFEIGTPRAFELTSLVARKFATSVDGARVRLEQSGILYTPLPEADRAAIFASPIPPGLAHCGSVLRRIAAQVGLKVDSREI